MVGVFAFREATTAPSVLEKFGSRHEEAAELIFDVTLAFFSRGFLSWKKRR